LLLFVALGAHIAMKSADLLRALDKFVGSRDVDLELLAGGHIHATYLTRGDSQLVIQRVNTNVFPNVDALERNIALTTAHVRQQKGQEGEKLVAAPSLMLQQQDADESLSPYYYTDVECGTVWRAFAYISGTVSKDMVDTDRDAFECALTFGRYARCLMELDAHRLVETIPDFHNTPMRYEALKRAQQESLRVDRVKESASEIAFVDARVDIFGSIMDALRSGAVPTRVTHNDAKFSNVLLDAETGRGVAVVDYDTVMPGSLLFDFGDLVRSSISRGREDEKDLSQVVYRPLIFEQLCSGFVKGLGGCTALTEAEAELLPLAGRIITLEQGMRFLTDHLNGDVYYGAAYDGQNLVRCRVALELVLQMERHEEHMQNAVSAALRGEVA